MGFASLIMQNSVLFMIIFPYSFAIISTCSLYIKLFSILIERYFTEKIQNKITNFILILKI